MIIINANHLKYKKTHYLYLLINHSLLFCVLLNRAVKKLLEKAGDILNVAKSDGFTTLHIAAINDHREIAKILLKQVNSFSVIPEYMKIVFGKKGTNEAKKWVELFSSFCFSYETLI